MPIHRGEWAPSINYGKYDDNGPFGQGKNLPFRNLSE